LAAEPSPAYPLGGTATELERLLAQAKGYEAQANRLFDEIGVGPGWNVLDIGCGPIGVLNVLSERVGPEGRVVGLEREARFVDMARAEIARRGLNNVEIVQADALSSGLPRESFDLVHTRLVMVNVSAREHLLSEMIGLARPGAAIALEEIDNISWMCHPPHPSWTLFIDAFHTLFHAGGGNGYLGRAVPGMMRAAGLEDVQMHIDVDAPAPGDYRRTHLVSLIDSMRDKVIDRALLDEQQLMHHRSALLAHLESPDTMVIDKLFVQAWGRKPARA
jgi:SAM-dependent methyltransferase